MTRGFRDRDLLLDVLRLPHRRRFSDSSIARRLAQLGLTATTQLVGGEKLLATWSNAVLRQGVAPPGWNLELRRLVDVQAHRSLVRRSMLRQAVQVLDDQQVPFVVFKGAHLAMVLYDAPWLRDAVDVDLLVASEDASRAVTALVKSGFSASSSRENLSHEMKLSGRGAELDLHWEVMRPSRLRQPLASRVLDARTSHEGIPVPNDLFAVVLMLTHTAITEHVTAHAGRAFDLHRWLLSRDVDWHAVLGVLGSLGLRCAAWSMLEWSRLWFDVNVPADVINALAPPQWKRHYLLAWLAADPGKLVRSHRNLVRCGFSLLLHDSPADSVTAMTGYARARVQELLEPTSHS